MAFDEVGQADTSARKIESVSAPTSCSRPTARPQRYHLRPEHLCVATGIEEHRRYAVDFIKAVREIRSRCPGTHISGGLSNLSFSSAAMSRCARAMHSVFLYHAIPPAWTWGSSRGQLDVYDAIDAELRDACEDVILDRSDDATER